MRAGHSANSEYSTESYRSRSGNAALNSLACRRSAMFPCRTRIHWVSVGSRYESDRYGYKFKCECGQRDQAVAVQERSCVRNRGQDTCRSKTARPSSRRPRQTSRPSERFCSAGGRKVGRNGLAAICWPERFLDRYSVCHRSALPGEPASTSPRLQSYFLTAFVRARGAHGW